MDRTILIDKYITQTLSVEEKVFFDELFANDPAFREEIHFLENIKKVAEVEDDAHAQEMVAGFEAEHHSKQKTFNTKIWWIAASLALLIGITYFAIQQGPPDTQVLFVENFEPYRNVVHPIVRSAQQQDLKTSAFAHYEKGEYQEALKLFQKLYETTKTPHYLFYKANAFLKLNRPKEAIGALQAHLKTKDTLTQKSHWYLAMAYLKLDDVANAKKSLEQVVAQNKYNVKKASTLLKTLD